MGNHGHLAWFISPEMFVLMLFSAPEYILEPAIPDAMNDKELLNEDGYYQCVCDTPEPE